MITAMIPRMAPKPEVKNMDMEIYNTILDMVKQISRISQTQEQINQKIEEITKTVNKNADIINTLETYKTIINSSVVKWIAFCIPSAIVGHPIIMKILERF